MTSGSIALEGVRALDLRDPLLHADPYPTYARLRRTTPLAAVHTPFSGRPGWMVTRYADVIAVLKDARFSTDMRKSREGRLMNARWMPGVFRILQNSMLNSDDPDHYRLRNLVHQAFTPRRIERMTVRIEEIANDLLDRAGQKREFDLISEFALPIPLTIISEMMGVPEKDRLRFHRWTGKFLEPITSVPWGLFARMPNAYHMLGFFKELIRLRRVDPQDDLVTGLVQAEAGGERLSEEELLSMIFLLLLAGHETTVNLIGNGTLALLEFPDQLRLLREQPALIDSAVEELLRYANPVEHGTMRIALEPVELCGQTIAPGETVIAMLASANRDENVFPNADCLDIRRQPNKHVAFGLGMHYCLGAPLARLEGRIALQALVRRCPDIQLAIAPERVQWRSTMAVRGVKELPLRLPDASRASI